MRLAPAQQQALLEGQLKPIRAAMRKIGPRTVADAQINVARERASNLVAFRRPDTEHTTPALDAAAGAAAPVEAAPLPAAAAAEHAQLVALFAASEPEPMASPTGNVRALRTGETPQQRFRRALDLLTRLEAGEALDAPDLLWLGGYREGAEFKALQAMQDDFGDAMRI